MKLKLYKLLISMLIGIGTAVPFQAMPIFADDTNTYTITFDPGTVPSNDPEDQKITGTMDSITTHSGTETVIPQFGYSSKNYKGYIWKVSYDNESDRPDTQTANGFYPGDKVKDLAKIGKTVKLTAQWTPTKYYRVIIDLQKNGDNTGDTSNQISLYVAPGRVGINDAGTNCTVEGCTNIEKDQIIPSRNNDKFIGWYDDPIKEDNRINTDCITSNLSLYAHYDTESNLKAAAGLFTFDSIYENIHMNDDRTSDITISMDKDSAAETGIYLNPNDDDFHNSVEYFDKQKDQFVSLSDADPDDLTWKASNGKPFGLLLHSDTQSSTSDQKACRITALPVLKAHGKKFLGWYTDTIDGDEQVTESTIIHYGMTVYAKWEDDLSNTAVSESRTLDMPEKRKITFDSDGGSNASSRTAYSGKELYLTDVSINDSCTEAKISYSDLPVPDKKGYVFDGWYTDSGKIVENSTICSGNMKLTAHWKKDDKNMKSAESGDNDNKSASDKSDKENISSDSNDKNEAETDKKWSSESSDEIDAETQNSAEAAGTGNVNTGINRHIRFYSSLILACMLIGLMAHIEKCNRE